MDRAETEICDTENCCSNCKHGSIPCYGLTFEPVTEDCTGCHGIETDCKYHKDK